MASTIPGYEYDIFISYRQKDNKYDGWVTEFVDNLKKEWKLPSKRKLASILILIHMMAFWRHMMLMLHLRRN